MSLNRAFYQRFAAEFSATRERVQPGVRRLLKRLPRHVRLLDLGCGNGPLARALVELGFDGVYLGLDFSPALLEAARRSLPGSAPFHVEFRPADLASPDWADSIHDQFDVATAYAVLHHLPGQDCRLQFLKQAHALLAASGQCYLSNWQFLRSPRFLGRIVPWESVGLAPDDVDPGDYLLDWRRGGRGLRYVHHFTQDELLGLYARAQFRVLDTFESDGHEGRLSNYAVLAKGEARPEAV